MNRITIIAAAVPLLLVAFSTNVGAQEATKTLRNSSEPTKCYRLLANLELDLTIGIALDACGGSLNGAKTVECLVEAWTGTNQGGLGLTIGQGIDLCRVNGNREK